MGATIVCRAKFSIVTLEGFREMKDSEQEFENDGEIKSDTSQMKLHLTDALQLRKRGLRDAEYQTKAATIKKRIPESSDRQARHPAIRKWRDFLVEKSARLDRWTAAAQIPAENNDAEREIRKVVIARKTSDGSQSADRRENERNVGEHPANTQKARSRSARQISERLKQTKANQRLWTSPPNYSAVQSLDSAKITPVTFY